MLKRIPGPVWFVISFTVLICCALVVLAGNRNKPLPATTQPLAIVPALTDTPRPAISESPTATPTDTPESPLALPPTMEPTTSAMPTVAVPLVYVEKDANLRSGPGTTYEVIGALSAEQMFEIIGRNSDTSWWQIIVNDKPGWVSADLVTTINTEQGIEVVEAPPALIPTPIPVVAPMSTAPPSVDGPAQPPAARACCMVCSKGKACGDSCIAADKQCNKPPGCAC
jgi:uncharacterized protein YraI